MYRGNGSLGEAGRSGGGGMAATDMKGYKSALGHPEPIGHLTCHLHASAHCAAYQMTEASNPLPVTGNIKFPLARQI